MTNEKNLKLITPFYPPQLAQDKFGQVVAPIPGATKLEVFTLQIFCAKIGAKIRENEPLIFSNLVADSLHEAKYLIEILNADNEKKRNTNTFEIIE